MVLKQYQHFNFVIIIVYALVKFVGSYHNFVFQFDLALCYTAEKESSLLNI